jgi:hypothetical protein
MKSGRSSGPNFRGSGNGGCFSLFFRIADRVVEPADFVAVPVPDCNLGPTGVGKSFVACALAQKACRDGYSALYTRAQSLFRDLTIARADGSLRNLLARLSRIDVLAIDD